VSLAGKPGRPVGLPKTGGRRKGTPNKSTVAIGEKLAQIGCDPILELAKIAMNGKTPIELRVRCLVELASYVYPKRKPVDPPQPTPLQPTFETVIETSASPSAAETVT